LGQQIANRSLEGLGFFTLIRLQVSLANEGLNAQSVFSPAMMPLT